MFQTFRIAHGAADGFGQFARGHHLLHQCLYLLAIHRRRDFCDSNDEPRDVLAAQSLANCILHLEGELVAEGIAGLHHHKQENRLVGIMGSASTNTQSRRNDPVEWC